MSAFRKRTRRSSRFVAKTFGWVIGLCLCYLPSCAEPSDPDAGWRETRRDLGGSAAATRPAVELRLVDARYAPASQCLIVRLLLHANHPGYSVSPRAVKLALISGLRFKHVERDFEWEAGLAPSAHITPFPLRLEELVPLMPGAAPFELTVRHQLYNSEQRVFAFYGQDGTVDESLPAGLYLVGVDCGIPLYIRSPGRIESQWISVQTEPSEPVALPGPGKQGRDEESDNQ